jgi:hypothetical protein
LELERRLDEFVEFKALEIVVTRLERDSHQVHDFPTFEDPSFRDCLGHHLYFVPNLRPAKHLVNLKPDEVQVVEDGFRIVHQATQMHRGIRYVGPGSGTNGTCRVDAFGNSAREIDSNLVFNRSVTMGIKRPPVDPKGPASDLTWTQIFGWPNPIGPDSGVPSQARRD